MATPTHTELNKKMSVNVGLPSNPNYPKDGVIDGVSHFGKYTNYPFTYETSNIKLSDSKESTEPLSMKFIHKPKRSDELLEQALDCTEYNSKMNAKIGGRRTKEGSEDDASSNKNPTSPDERNGLGLVRKKSGELVKSSLKDSSGACYFDKKRSLSLPTTPTYKQVHFGSNNDIRYFKKKDRPAAISASNSPTLDDSDFLLSRLDLEDDSDLDNPEFSLSHGETMYPGRSAAEWTLELLNFLAVNYDKKIKKENSVIFLERVYLSDDNKSLIGHIAVKNIVFEKHVTVRYTLDNWLTVIEIPTSYYPNAPSVLKDNNYDRFIFRIPSDKLFNSFRMNPSFENLNNKATSLEKIYNFCFRYNTYDKEFWDNNYKKNYSIKLSRAAKGQNLINDHKVRPRYSSSYLTRRASDSAIAQNNKTNNNENRSSNLDSSDFVRNDFYLSSPLLSSLNSNENAWKDKYNDIIKSDNNSPDVKISDLSNELEDENNSNQFTLGVKNEPLSIPSINKNLLNTKSYKELLDTYCFFSSSPEDSIPSTTTPSNRSSISFSNTSNSKGQNEDVSGCTDSSISISTFLGK